MNVRQGFSLLLIVLTIIVNYFSVFAVPLERESVLTTLEQRAATPSEPDAATPSEPARLPEPAETVDEDDHHKELPQFNIELAEYTDVPGLYGTLSYIPADAVSIMPMYWSENMDADEEGYSYITYVTDSGTSEYRAWSMSDLDDSMPVTQFCAGISDEPVSSYLTGNVKYMKILLEITAESGESFRTDPAVLVLDEPPLLPGTCNVELRTDTDDPGLYVELEHMPENLAMVSVLYSFGSPDYILENCDGKTWYTHPEDYSDSEELLSCQVNDDGSVRLFSFAKDEHPLSSYLSESVNTLYIQVMYYTENYEDYVEFEPVRFSHDKTYEIPETPPPFTADFELGWYSYSVIGHFTDFPPNVKQVNSTYSWDNITYQPVADYGSMRWHLENLGNDDAEARKRLENQECANYYTEPLESYLAGQRDAFYLRLEIITEDDEIYYSQPAYLSHGGLQALPEYLIPRAAMGFDMSMSEGGNETFGQIQLTVREDASWEEIKALLPDTVPVRIRFFDKETKEKIAFGDVPCEVIWKEPPSFTLVPGESVILEDMAEPLVIPAGTEVKTDLADYGLLQPLTFQGRYDSDHIRLVLNVVSAEDEPRVGLQAREDWFGNDVMSLAFWNKPSGADSIKAYVLADGEQMEICDLLDRRDIDHNQSHALYGYVPLFDSDQYPYSEYLSGNIDGFTVELVIEGGVYGGRTVTLPWPQEYEMPEQIFDPSGTEGQENDAGSWDEGNGTEEGQRPDLPSFPDSGEEDIVEESKPPVSEADQAEHVTPEVIPDAADFSPDTNTEEEVIAAGTPGLIITPKADEPKEDGQKKEEQKEPNGEESQTMASENTPSKEPGLSKDNDAGNITHSGPVTDSEEPDIENIPDRKKNSDRYGSPISIVLIVLAVSIIVRVLAKLHKRFSKQ